MKRIILIFLCLFGCAFGDVYNYPASIETVLQQTPEIKSIKCKFKQEKYLNNIPKPLISYGDFEFKENKGIYFYTKYPIQAQTDYTSDKYKQINDVIIAISNKKYSKLEKEFDFYYVNEKKSWFLGLKPKKNTKTKNYISSITIEGTSYINKVVINQTNGNKTQIWFTN